MATYTENYHLSKPETTDSQQSFIEDYATNMDIIDENMGGGSGGGHVIINENDTEMVQEPKMQFAGKVSVTDDSINEKTVVTLPEEVKEVTLAEYESIPVAERESNGIAYFIKDLNNSNVQGYPPLIYSDEEREIGVWRDGKPLYTKTYTANITTNTQWIDTVLDSGDLIVKSEGTLEQNNGQILTLASGDTGAGAGINTFIVGVVTPSKWSCLFRTNNNDARGNLTLTLYYTKGSDVAGSGTWNGQGGIAHHYSTNETVVGTWIDGKPLYERTVLISALPNTSYVNTNYPHGIADIDNIVEWDGYGIWSNGTVQKLGTIQFSNNGFGQIPSTFAQVDKTNIVIMTGMNRSAVSGRFIIKYTKTTD